MGMIFILMVLALVYIIMINTVSMGNQRKKCDERGVRHVWVYEEENGKKYMICANCKYNPLIQDPGDNNDPE